MIHVKQPQSFDVYLRITPQQAHALLKEIQST